MGRLAHSGAGGSPLLRTRAFAFLVVVALVVPLVPFPSADALPATAGASAEPRWVARTGIETDARDQPVAVAVGGGRTFAAITAGLRPGNETDVVLRANDVATGAVLWTYTFDGPTHGVDSEPFLRLAPDASRVFAALRMQNATFTRSNPSGDYDLAVLALDASTGGLLWESRYDGGWVERPGGLAVAPDGSAIYTVSQSVNNDRARDLSVVGWNASTGAKLWETRLDPTTEHPYNSGWIGPVEVSADGSFLIAGGDSFHAYSFGNLLAFRIETDDGALAWRQKWIGPGGRGERAHAVAISGDGAVALVGGLTEEPDGSANPLLVAYDAGTGAELWNRTDAQAGNWELVTDLAVDSTKVYALQWTAAEEFAARASRIRAIDLATGVESWNDTIPAGTAFTMPAGIAADGAVIRSVVNAPGAHVVAHDAASGARLSDRAASPLASLRADFAGADAALLSEPDDASMQEDARVSWWDAALDAVAWSSTYSTRGSAWDTAAASALAGDGSRFYVVGSTTPSPTGGDILTVAYDTATGGELWQARYDASTRDEGMSAASLAGNPRVYVSGHSFDNLGTINEHVVLAYEPDGTLAWSRTIKGPAEWPLPASRLLAAPDAATLYLAALGPAGLYAAALDPATGVVLWERDWGTRFVDVFVDATLSNDGTRLLLLGQVKGLYPVRDTRIVSLESATGAESWNATFQGSGEDDPRAIDSAGGSVAIAVTTGPSGSRDGTILSFALADGALEWTRAIDSGGSDVVYDLAYDGVGAQLALTGSWDELDYWERSEALTAVLDAADGSTTWQTIHVPPVPNPLVLDDVGTHVTWSVDEKRVLAAGREGDDLFASSYDSDTGTGRPFSTYDGGAHGISGWDDLDEPVGIAVGPEERSFYVAGTSMGDGTDRDLLGLLFYLGRPPSEPWDAEARRGPGGARITVEWAAPNSTGDDPILGYRIYGARDGDPLAFRGETNVTTFVDENLEPDTRYDYRVTAFSESGESDASAIVSARTYPLPSEPRSPRASTGPYGGQITVSWTVPEDSGGLPIEGYVLSRGETPDALAPVGSAGPSDRSWADAGLPASTRFYYSVAARTEAGLGPGSAVVDAVSPSAPSAPRNVAADRGPNRGEISLRWIPPASDGGVVLQAYHVYRGASADALEEVAILASPSFSYLDAGLPDATTFFYAVTADNGIQGPASAPISQRTPELPGAPPNAVAANGPTDGEITVQWLPATSGGTAILRYEIWRGDSAASLAPYAQVEGTKRSFVDSAIPRGESRWYAVRAVNAVGEGPFGGTVTAYAPTLPSEPRNVRSAPGTLPGEVRVTWSVPVSFGGIRLLGYNVYSSDGGPPELTATVGPSTTSFTDSLRTPLTPRYYWISAFNAVGEGPLAAGGCSNPAPWATIAQATGPCDRLVP